ncbi:MAG: SRPBCC domain-containing protein [Ignavibacteriales bacterium]|nr:SRPBCC domain-containing protein [Ignavibacteriales bacterium]
MLEKIKTSVTISTTPEILYKAWLNSKEHSAFTGGKAVVSSKVGAGYTAWNGYISGKNILLYSNKKIIQSWRSTDFPAGCPDSRLEIIFGATKTGTKITLIHSDLPEGQGNDYKKGWKDFYFQPMKKYYKKK